MSSNGVLSMGCLQSFPEVSSGGDQRPLSALGPPPTPREHHQPPAPWGRGTEPHTRLSTSLLPGDCAQDMVWAPWGVQGRDLNGNAPPPLTHARARARAHAHTHTQIYHLNENVNLWGILCYVNLYKSR